MLTDEEEAKKAKKEGVKALKRRIREKTSTFTPVDVSSKGTQSAELPEYQTIRATSEAKERSSEVGTSFLGTVAKLIEAGITPKNCSKRLKAFRTFIKVVLAKLDVFEITNS